MEALSNSLRNEVREFGIDVLVVEPGATKSDWGDIAFDSLVKVLETTAYKELADKTHKAFTQLSDNIPEPIVIAKLIKKGIEAKNPKTRYAGGHMASIVLLLGKVLPDKLMDKVIMSQLK